MKIKQIKIYSHPLPVVNQPYTMADSQIWHLDTTLVELITHNGLVGWGENCPLGSAYASSHVAGAVAAIEQMAPHLISADVATPMVIQRLINNQLNWTLLCQSSYRYRDI